MIAIHPEDTWEYILKEDEKARERAVKEAEEKGEASPFVEVSVFTLRPISALEWARIEDSSAKINAKSSDIEARTGSKVLETLRLGLAGWKGVRFNDGSEVKFDTTTRGAGKSLMVIPTDRTLACIPPKAREELCDAISRGNVPTAEELGN